MHGPPGTGKNSLAKAIVSRKQWDIRSIPCRDETLGDDEFLDLLANLHQSKPSILLLDKFDIAIDEKRYALPRPANLSPGINRGTLLGVLDGPYSPSNVLIILTANKTESLGDAILRKGRVDHIITIIKDLIPMAKELFLNLIIPRQ